MFRSLAAALALPLLAPASTAVRGEGEALDFPALAAEFLERGGLDADGLTRDSLLASPAFVSLELGQFDVRIAVQHLADKDDVELLQRAARVLLATQGDWLAWRFPGVGSEEEVELLDGWIDDWKPSRMTRLDGGGSLFELLGAEDEVVAARDSLLERTAVEAPVAELVGPRCVTVLAPSRRHFLELAAAMGEVHAEKRGSLWSPALVGMAAAWDDWVQLVALENSPTPPDPNAPFLGVSLDRFHKSGLAQHVADRGSMILLRKTFLHHGTHFFEQSLATNLVIGAAGQKGSFTSDEWDMRWSRAGGKTDPYERFVPGGASYGTLPPRKAKAGDLRVQRSGGPGPLSRYAEGFGADWFVEGLRDGQKAGYKLARRDHDNPLRTDEVAHFELVAAETRDETAVTAPFLGVLAEEKPLPDHAFLDDYEDFFRAYRSCFLEWLRREGVGGEEESAELFGRLIRGQATRAEGRTLDEVVLGIYGVPLSAENGETDSLEWRFLRWLAD